MTNCKHVSTLLSVLVLVAVNGIAAPSAKTTTKEMVTVTVNAPIYFGPEVSQTPLRVVAPGTLLRIIQQQGDWIQVEFKTGSGGSRVAGSDRRC
jgi:hypothetical protein